MNIISHPRSNLYILPPSDSILPSSGSINIYIYISLPPPLADRASRHRRRKDLASGSESEVKSLHRILPRAEDIAAPGANSEIRIGWVGCGLSSLAADAVPSPLPSLCARYRFLAACVCACAASAAASWPLVCVPVLPAAAIMCFVMFVLFFRS